MPIDGSTKLYLLLGNPVAHSLSPSIYNAAFSALSLNNAYLACPVDKGDVEAAIRGMKALSIAGANVTAPLKEAVIAHLDSLSPVSKQVKSVNTIISRNGKLHGTTTDGEGFYHALMASSPGFRPGQTILVIGSGGAARALAYTLAARGAGKIIIANRSENRAKTLSTILKKNTPLQRIESLPLEKKSLEGILSQCSLVVYSLPFDAPQFLDALSKIASLEQKQLLVDLRYKPERTGVMQAFEEKGGISSNGLGMLFWQAVKAFEIFTGHAAPVEVMQKAAGIHQDRPSK